MGLVTSIDRGSLVTAKAVAEYLAVAESTVTRMARNNELPAVRVRCAGRKGLWRFRMADIEAWVDSQVDKVSAPPAEAGRKATA